MNVAAFLFHSRLMLANHLCRAATAGAVSKPPSDKFTPVRRAWQKCTIGGHSSTMAAVAKMSLKVYYDLMSQPCRALVIFLKQNNIPYTDCEVALRKGRLLNVDCLRLY